MKNKKIIIIIIGVIGCILLSVIVSCIIFFFVIIKPELDAKKEEKSEKEYYVDTATEDFGDKLIPISEEPSIPTDENKDNLPYTAEDYGTTVPSNEENYDTMSQEEYDAIQQELLAEFGGKIFIDGNRAELVDMISQDAFHSLEPMLKEYYLYYMPDGGRYDADVLLDTVKINQDIESFTIHVKELDIDIQCTYIGTEGYYLFDSVLNENEE